MKIAATTVFIAQELLYQRGSMQTYTSIQILIMICDFEENYSYQYFFLISIVLAIFFPMFFWSFFP